MSDEFKDRRIKYVDLPRVFEQRASEIRIAARMQLRACERLAGHLSRQKPNNPTEFDRNEWLKDFVMKTADMNDKTLALMEYLKTEIQQVSDDAKALMEGGVIQDRLRDQSDSITALQNFRDQTVINIYEHRKAQLRQDKATA